MADGKGEFDRALGERIREAREQVGMRQEQLAQDVGLSRTSITNIERGRQGVRAHLLVRIADALSRPPADLLPSVDSRSLPKKVQELEPRKREWAKRVMRTQTEDDDNAA